MLSRKRLNMREERLRNAENILYVAFSLNWYHCSRTKTLCANPNLTSDFEIIVANIFRFLGNTASYHNNTLFFTALDFPTAHVDFRCWHSSYHQHHPNLIATPVTFATTDKHTAYLSWLVLSVLCTKTHGSAVLSRFKKEVWLHDILKPFSVITGQSARGGGGS